MHHTLIPLRALLSWNFARFLAQLRARVRVVPNPPQTHPPTPQTSRPGNDEFKIFCSIIASSFMPPSFFSCCCFFFFCGLSRFACRVHLVGSRFPFSLSRNATQEPGAPIYLRSALPHRYQVHIIFNTITTCVSLCGCVLVCVCELV